MIRGSGRTLRQLQEVAAYLESRPAARATYIIPSGTRFDDYARELLRANHVFEEVISRIDFMSPKRFAYGPARGQTRQVFVDHAATVNLPLPDLREFDRVLSFCRTRFARLYAGQL